MSKEVLAEAVRIDYEEKTGKIFLIFEIRNEKFKQEVKKNWTQDIEYRLIDKNLVLEEEDE